MRNKEKKNGLIDFFSFFSILFFLQKFFFFSYIFLTYAVKYKNFHQYFLKFSQITTYFSDIATYIFRSLEKQRVIYHKRILIMKKIYCYYDGSIVNKDYRRYFINHYCFHMFKTDRLISSNRGKTLCRLR